MREQSEGPLEASERGCVRLQTPLGVCLSVRRSVGRVAKGRARELLERQGRDVRVTPGELADSSSPGIDPLDAPGLPSRVGYPLGMPFGLATPGGQPVAV